MFVFLESAWHPIADDERTECGIVIPPLETWVREVPDGEPIHCGPEATVHVAIKVTAKTIVNGKPAAKAKAKK